MSARPRSRFVAAAIAVPLVVVLASCSDGDKKKATAAANAACPTNISQTASTALPSDLPSPGGTVYDYSSQGKTQVWFAAVNGSADQLASLRDSYDTQLTGKGYSIEGTDQEAGAEADSEFKGPHEGTTNFRPLCSGKVVLRLKITS
jgi:hypothetical protein